jgi:hypothetical protein
MAGKEPVFVFLPRKHQPLFWRVLTPRDLGMTCTRPCSFMKACSGNTTWSLVRIKLATTFSYRFQKRSYLLPSSSSLLPSLPFPLAPPAVPLVRRPAARTCETHLHLPLDAWSCSYPNMSERHFLRVASEHGIITTSSCAVSALYLACSRRPSPHNDRSHSFVLRNNPESRRP